MKYIYRFKSFDPTTNPNTEIDIPNNAEKVTNNVFYRVGDFICVVSWLEPTE